MTHGYEFTPQPERVPPTQPAFSGGPPQPPPPPTKVTARDLMEPGDGKKKIFVPDYIGVRELAELLEVKPFRVVAELMALKIFKHANELVDFATATRVAGKHGVVVERLW